MAHIFITRALPELDLDLLRDRHEVDLWAGELPPTPAELLAHARDCEGLLCTLTDGVDAEVIAACPKVRVISNYAVGTDNIDLAAAHARDIAVGNTPDVLTDATADLTFALLLAVARRLEDGAAAVRAGEWRTWEPSGWLGADLTGATLGIVGLGRIGRAVARRAEGFGMKVVHSSRSSGVSLEDLLSTSDFVSLHCPLTPETHHLIKGNSLKLMKPTAILINTARGPLIDQVALRESLRSGGLGGAGLDVTDPEPLPADDPLLTAPNLIILPHIGSATHGTRRRMTAIAVENLLAGVEGRPLPHPVRE